VHEAYLRLASGSRPREWANEAHFFAAASRAMRRILIERARRRRRRDRLSGQERVTLDGVVFTAGPSADGPDPSLLDLNDALERLKRREPRAARIVELRFFSGLELAKIAELLEVSPRTVKREWAFARSWLHDELEGGDSSPSA
jgi:RNA polymerase sigma factor (TIGR02999 family)